MGIASEMRSVAAGAALLALAGCSNSGARDQIKAVGSSTVYPFAAAVVEQFVNKNPQFKSPVIEQNGTGAGFKLFCAGVGVNHPDIINASRRMKPTEYADCAKNGVGEVIEVQIGLDGIAFAESRAGLKLALSTADIYEALAARPYGRLQTARTWRDVNPELPDEPIKVYGPPSTSGTRDALAELVMTKGCDSDPAMKALAKSDKDKHKRLCTTVREDGAYIDAGENDNLIVQKIEGDPKAVGVFGYSFLEENKDLLIGNTMDGIVPTYASISDFSYPGARPLYIYVKAAHAKAIPGIRAFMAEFASAWGQDGYLRRRGMVIAPAHVQAASSAIVRDMTPLDPAALG